MLWEDLTSHSTVTSPGKVFEGNRFCCFFDCRCAACTPLRGFFAFQLSKKFGLIILIYGIQLWKIAPRHFFVGNGEASWAGMSKLSVITHVVGKVCDRYTLCSSTDVLLFQVIECVGLTRFLWANIPKKWHPAQLGLFGPPTQNQPKSHCRAAFRPRGLALSPKASRINPKLWVGKG